MAEERKYLEEVVDYMDNLERAVRVDKGLGDGRIEVREQYKEEAKEIAYSALIEIDHDLQERFSNEKDLPEDLIGDGLKFYKESANEKAVNTFYENRRRLIKEIPRAKLETLALQEFFVESADNKYAELIEKLGAYKGIDDLVSRYERGEKLSDKEEKMFRENAAMGKAKAVQERLESEGYSKELQGLAANIAVSIIKKGYVSEKVMKESARKIVSEAEKNLREYEKESGLNAENYAEETFVKLAEDSDGEKFWKILGLTYSVMKDKKGK